MNNFHFVENFKKGDIEAVMRINKPIGEGKNEISGQGFTSELDALVNAGVQKIVFPINSPGGNVIHGLEILSAIQDLTIDNETRVVGIAASIAGVIAQAGRKRTIKKHAVFMAHSPRPKEGTTASASVLNIAYNSIKGVLTSKSKLSEDEITDILSKDTFMSAEEATNKGLFDEVLTSENKAPQLVNLSVNEIYNVFNQFENKKDMSKINSLLGLQNEASENAQIAEIERLRNEAGKVSDLENSVSTMKAEKEALETELKAANKVKAVSLIENAVKAGKLKVTEDKKTELVNQAIDNYTGVETMLEAVPSVIAAQHIEIDNQEGSDEKSKWTYEDWSKNDEEGLAKMKIENSAKFDKLFNAYID